MGANLRVADGLTLPISAVTEKLAFLGRTGQGKTYAAQKLAEEMHRADAQFVAFDPVGKWWSLRLAANGKSKGIPVPVFGGLHGDIPLEPTAGKLIADLVADRGISVILDVSQFEHDTDKVRFAKDFGARFFFRKTSEPSAVHLFLEEAQEFVPQEPQKNETDMLHVFTRIWKLGRNHGIGGSLITQRPQEVSKKVLNLTEVLFAFQLSGSHERASVEKWIKDKDIKGQDIQAMLPKLKQGHPHVWSPAWLEISKVVSIRDKWTFDASSTPKVGARTVKAQPLAPIDLEKIKKQMTETIEKAKQTDPKLLQRENARLTAELQRANTFNTERQTAGKPKEVIKKVEVPVIKEAQMRRLEKITERLVKVQNTVAALAAEVRTALSRPTSPLPEPAPVKFERSSSTTHPTNVRALKVRIENSSDNGKLGGGERKMLSAIAQYPDGISNETLTVLTGYRQTSRYEYTRKLKAAGYIESRGDEWTMTQAGRLALGHDYEPLPTGAALRDHWLHRLRGGELAIFKALLNHWPNTVELSQLGEEIGYKQTSRYEFLRKLKARKLVEFTDNRNVRASPKLYE